MPDRGIRRADPVPRTVRAGPYAIDAATDTETADRGRVYARAGYGPELQAGCAACVEASDRRGGWWSRPLYPGEDVGCWLCGWSITWESGRFSTRSIRAASRNASRRPDQQRRRRSHLIKTKQSCRAGSDRSFRRDPGRVVESTRGFGRRKDAHHG